MNDLKQRINAAIRRIAEGRAPMSIPADPRSDADIVLADCEREIDRLNAALQERGNAALEEAARVCDHLSHAYGSVRDAARDNTETAHRADSAMYAANNAATRIRALKSQEQQDG